MSYIRCLSNPEELYIWGDGKYANFSSSIRKKFPDTLYKMPQKTFDNLLKKYKFKGDTRYKGARIREVFVKNGKLNPKCVWKLVGKYDGNFKMRLSYKKWHIDMWLVTWEYIVRHREK